MDVRKQAGLGDRGGVRGSKITSLKILGNIQNSYPSILKAIKIIILIIVNPVINISKYNDMQKIHLFKTRGQIGNRQIMTIIARISHIQSLLSFIVIVHTKKTLSNTSPAFYCFDRMRRFGYLYFFTASGSLSSLHNADFPRRLRGKNIKITNLSI